MTTKAALAETVFASFELIADPRAPNRRFRLDTILLVAIVGTLCGADGFVQIERVAQSKRELIARYVQLPDGELPTHDTISRLFQVLAPKDLIAAYRKFVAALTGKSFDEIIALDGKTLRGAVRKSQDAVAVAEDVTHMVSAFSSTRSVVLAQLRAAAKQNENVAARELIGMLDLDGAVVTMDAAHCSAETIAAVKQRGGDVVVALKGNQPRLLADVEDAFSLRAMGAQAHIEEEKGHGRRERRVYEVLSVETLRDERWADVRSIIRVERERTILSTDERSTTTVHYVTTLPPEQHERIAAAIRRHWAVENNLHWNLDVQFDEDGSRVRTGNAAENLARVRHIALALLSEARSPSAKPKEKDSIKTKRLLAATEAGFLEKILRQSA